MHRHRSVRRPLVTVDGENLVSHAGTGLLAEISQATAWWTIEAVTSHELRGINEAVAAARAKVWDAAEIKRQQAHRDRPQPDHPKPDE